MYDNFVAAECFEVKGVVYADYFDGRCLNLKSSNSLKFSQFRRCLIQTT